MFAIIQYQSKFERDCYNYKYHVNFWLKHSFLNLYLTHSWLKELGAGNLNPWLWIFKWCVVWLLESFCPYALNGFSMSLLIAGSMFSWKLTKIYSSNRSFKIPTHSWDIICQSTYQFLDQNSILFLYCKGFSHPFLFGYLFIFVFWTYTCALSININT